MIRQSGFFVIGGENNAASYKISDVLSLFVQSTTIEIYDFERLQDLESRLVLIAGQNAENTEEVQDFLNVNQTLIIIQYYYCYTGISHC